MNTRTAPSMVALPETPVGRVSHVVRQFLHLESAAGLVLLGCAAVALAVAIWGTEWATSDLPMAADNIRSLGRLIMTKFVLPFEIVSVLLL